MATTFNPLVRTVPQAAQELTKFLIASRIKVGTMPASVGVTKPSNIESVVSVEDIMPTVNAYDQEVLDKKGVSGLESVITPTGLGYKSRLRAFVGAEEGTRLSSYLDTKGKRTVGTGFNMDRPDARQVWGAAGIETAFDMVYARKASLTRDEADRLLDFNLNEAEQVVVSRTKGLKLSEHQQMALTSMAFNGPALIGPKIIDAIRRGDEKGALDEILFNSGTARHPQWVSRRWREAHMFAGPASKSPHLPKYADYKTLFAKKG